MFLDIVLFSLLHFHPICTYYYIDININTADTVCFAGEEQKEVEKQEVTVEVENGQEKKSPRKAKEEEPGQEEQEGQEGEEEGGQQEEVGGWA